MTNNNGAVSASKKSRAYAPRWVSLIMGILDGLYDGTRSLADDNITKRITMTSLKSLAKGIALSDGQRDALIGNIRTRLGDDRFEWHGTIKLNRSQLPGARKLLATWESKEKVSSIDAGSAQDLPTATGQLEARLAALEEEVAKLRLLSDVEAGPLPHNSSTNAANLPCNALQQNAFRGAMKRNDTKRNHEVDVICLSGGVTDICSAVASNDVGSSTGDNKSKIGHEAEPERRLPEHKIVVSYFRRDPARAPSARLEIGHAKYNLVFHSADVAEDKLRSVCSREWLGTFEENIGHRLRAKSRANPSTDLRYVMSQVYGEGDPFGFKEPALQNCVAVLHWGDDLQPEAVSILDAEFEANIVELRAIKKGKSNGPTHKGSLRLAA